MINIIDRFLNKITMYRLLLYYLIGLLVIAFVLSLFHSFSFSAPTLFFSAVFFLVVNWMANTFLAKIFHAQTNVESVYITALILTLIVSPIMTTQGFITDTFISLFAIASKYVLTIDKKHVFNPAAFGVFIVGLILGQNASWWIGTMWMMPFVFLGGLLIVRKIQRFDLTFSFFIAALLTITVFSMIGDTNDIITIIRKTILETPLFFFAFVMLTEPLTTPPTKNLQTYYGVLTGILFAPQLHVLKIFFSPEEALLIGNVYSYLISPKVKVFLYLKEKIQIAPDIFDFVFVASKKFSFTPGQYMEWTLAHANSDSRGSRRYFTLASSPTEDTIRIGVRFNHPSSSLKKKLIELNASEELVASQVAGDFILPKDPDQKIVFLAGGIGITPFRSMIKYLLDTKQKREVILFYTAKNPEEFVYKRILNEAVRLLGIKVIYTITNKHVTSWNGRIGRIDSKTIQDEISDYKKCLFYIAGPQSMVRSFYTTLKEMGVSDQQIKQDYFPGFA